MLKTKIKLPKNFRSRSGFTIIELLVAVALFAIIVDVAAGGFVRALRAQRQTAALLAANSNAVLVLEQMFREIRTGSDVCLSAPAPDSFEECGDNFTFLNAEGNSVTYCFLRNQGAINRLEGGGDCIISGQAITAKNVNVRYADFMVFGNTPSNCPGGATCKTDSYPPRVTIRIGVSPKNEVGVSESVLRLQTTVSARTLD